ncbi:uncharacterized protein V6R79_008515 [Siganus canaliculatus]
MASSEAPYDSDDGMDDFMDKFRSQRYKNGFSEKNWEEEFDKVPMFMRTAPEEIDPNTHPELACLQAMIHDEDRPPEVQARNLKDEGNAFFKERSYQKAVACYSAGLQKKSGDQELHVVLLTNRAAAHFHLGNMRSALNDAAEARRIQPQHLKALVRGAQCCLELRLFSDALQWCEQGLQAHPSDRKLLELRAAADKHKRAAERDARRTKAQEKKLLGQKEALLSAIQARGVRLLQTVKPHGSGSGSGSSDSDEDEGGSSAALSQLSRDVLRCQEVTGSQVFLDENGSLHWPVLFLYPEHQQSDFISAFAESSRFTDHLELMFGEERPPWDADRKYLPHSLQLYFEDEQKETLYPVDPDTSLLKVLQHPRFFVKGGAPSFMVLVKGSGFLKQFLSERKVHGS